MSKRAEKREHHSPSDNEDEDALDEEGEQIEGIYIPSLNTATSNEITGPRLMIMKIENNFFKSYGEDEKIGPFHKCFNAIVGPNGSGKSNIIDSMLFVFGYRATKIRSKKLSVLIHNTDRFKNVQSCTVSVHFALIEDKEGDAYDVVPGSEFVVSRTAHKDGSSYYTLDGRKVQFKEIAQLLRKHGIDLDHNRFLILQGEVEQIAMMKPKAQNEQETGILEYLEDIIGTSRLKSPLTQLDDKMEFLQGLRSEKLNRVKLIQNALDELKEPMQDAVDFLKLENEIITKKNILYQLNVLENEEKQKELQEKFNEIDAMEMEITEKLNSMSKTKQEKESILTTMSKKYEHMEKKRDTLKDAFQAANNKDLKLQAEMTQMNETRKKNKQLLLKEQKKLQELKDIPEKNQQTIDECTNKVQKCTVEKNQLEEEKTKKLASIKSVTVPLQEEKAVLQTDLIELRRKAEESKSALTISESELKICISNEESESEKLIDLKNRYENNKKIISERTDTICDLKKKIPLTEKSLDGAYKDLQTNKSTQQTLITEIRKKRSYVEESKAAFQSSKSQGRVLDALMQQKREGNCPGLFGRLGDLGAIDLKYDVAVCTACGALENIVVDNADTAQWCIEFIKHHNIGRGTFIALDKQDHLKQQAFSKINTPENVLRLYDLIKTKDDRVRTAFYYALRDTLVVSDINQATRIAYGAQRFRVVTLTGDLIETTGTMSGGGKSVSRGRMGQSVNTFEINPEELKNVESDLQKMEDQMRQLNRKQNSLENQIATLEPELTQMKMNLQKFVSELKLAEQEKPILERQLKVQEKKSKETKSDPIKVRKLTAIVKHKQVAYDEALEAAEQLQIQVDKLTDEIKGKTVEPMKGIDKKLKDVNRLIDNCNNEITRLQVGITTSARNVEKCTEKIASLQQDITSTENSLRQMHTQREEIESDGRKLLTTIEAVVAQITEREQEFSDIKQEVAALVKEVNKLKAEKIEIGQKHKSLNKKLNEIKGETVECRAKLQKLELNEIPEETTETLKQYEREELLSKNLNNIQKEVQLKQGVLKNMNPNLDVLEEYHKKRATFIERSKELNEVSERKLKVKEAYDRLRSRRREEFMHGFNIIRKKLKEMYQMITLGGDADFELLDIFDPFAEGVQFNVRPPKKSWKIISNLSGGEKTLSSLALVFALHHYKPSPLYVMDEIDAALDFRNVSIVGNYIKDRTKNAQFIIISLRSNMFELCDYLIGIHKTYNCTHSICIDPRIYEKKKTNTNSAPTHSTQTNQTTLNEVEHQKTTNEQNCQSNLSNDIEDQVEDEITTDEQISEEAVNNDVINDSMETE